MLTTDVQQAALEAKGWVFDHDHTDDVEGYELFRKDAVFLYVYIDGRRTIYIDGCDEIPLELVAEAAAILATKEADHAKS